jgi:hypothetical protein
MLEKSEVTGMKTHILDVRAVPGLKKVALNKVKIQLRV